MKPRIGVITFPGTCDDRDALRAIGLIGGEPVALWHADDSLDGCTGVIVPGGFSYGDYLRAGAIARFAPMMREVEAFAAAGGPVLGICNGFQVLCEAGLLPGVLRPNHHGRFVCRDVDLVVQRAGSPWLAGLEPGDVLRVPVKHHDGAWYAPPDEQERVEAAGQVALRYADNPNGALADIACVTNAAGNVCGLMPHPEHAVDPALGSIGGRPLLKGLLTLARVRSKKASAVPSAPDVAGATRSNESSINSSIIVGARLPSSVTVIQCRLFMWYPGAIAAWSRRSSSPCSGSHLSVSCDGERSSPTTAKILPATL